ncbi:MAG: metal-dependent phosphohydrolase [Leptolyngbyaceae cyanobacterium]
MPEINNYLAWICDRYQALFGQVAPRHDQVFLEFATPMLMAIGQGDAPFHNLRHALQVAQVGQLILEGKQQFEGSVSPTDWLHLMLALVSQDIGFVKGIFERDCEIELVFYDGNCGQVKLPSTATGSALFDCHVDRSKAYVMFNLRHPRLDAETIQRYVETTRFPIPQEAGYHDNLSYGGLCRAADLLGQLSAPHYLQNLSNLFQEFEENGMNQILGYRTPTDLQYQYPNFFWQVVYPYVKGSMRYLSATKPGRQAIAQLYTNLCLAEMTHPPCEAPVEMTQWAISDPIFLPWQESGFIFS